MTNRVPQRVVFACLHNAGRSQMAAAFFNALVDSSSARAVSAGTRPGARVHPVVVEAMREVGIDVSHETPRLLTPEVAAGAGLLVTMGCGEECPIVPGAQREDWPLEDPANLPIERVRVIRDDLRKRVVLLVDTHGWRRS